MAFEDQLSGPHAAPQAAPAMAREPLPAFGHAGPAGRGGASAGEAAPPVRGGGAAVEAAPSPRGGAASAPRQSPPAAPAPREGAMLVDPPVVQPSKPIVQVVSKHPPTAASNFGELLKRSLSLRPR
jgi:DNA polymerase-3 subunit gamma/tau